MNQMLVLEYGLEDVLDHLLLDGDFVALGPGLVSPVITVDPLHVQLEPYHTCGYVLYDGDLPHLPVDIEGDRENIRRVGVEVALTMPGALDGELG